MYIANNAIAWKRPWEVMTFYHPFRNKLTLRHSQHTTQSRQIAFLIPLVPPLRSQLCIDYFLWSATAILEERLLTFRLLLFGLETFWQIINPGRNLLQTLTPAWNKKKITKTSWNIKIIKRLPATKGLCLTKFFDFCGSLMGRQIGEIVSGNVTTCCSNLKHQEMFLL